MAEYKMSRETLVGITISVCLNIFMLVCIITATTKCSNNYSYMQNFRGKYEECSEQNLKYSLQLKYQQNECNGKIERVKEIVK